MFDNINTETMRKGLEEALKHQINLIETEVEKRVGSVSVPQRNSLRLDTLRLFYAGLSQAARECGLDTTSYDLTCTRLVEKLSNRVYPELNKRIAS